MTGPQTRDDLERMKRADLQKLCKDYGVKANLKTESIIEHLLDTFENSTMRPFVATQATRRTSARSRTASHATGSKSRGFSGRSVIIHDEDDELHSEPLDEKPHVLQNGDKEETMSSVSQSRTRKANETQRRLGVGRPVVAGGSGARAVTKSISVGPKRAKNSKSIKPVQETIQEEPEAELSPSVVSTSKLTVNMSQPGPSHIHQGAKAASPSLPVPLETDADLRSRVGKLEFLLNRQTERDHDSQKTLSESVNLSKKMLDERNRDLVDLRSELQLLRADVATLRTQASRVSTLESELNVLKEQISLATSQKGSEEASGVSASLANLPAESLAKRPTVRRVSAALADSNTNTIPPKTSSTTTTIPTSVPQIQAHATQPALRPSSGPGPSVSALGKRQRDSTSSNVTGVFEAGQEDQISEKELAKRVVRPNKKRAKLSEEAESQPASQGLAPLSAVDSASPQKGTSGSASGSTRAFAVRPDTPDAVSSRHPSRSPPPTACLPEFFGASLDESTPVNGPFGDAVDMGTVDVASENANPFFNFTFSAPSTSTPITGQHDGMFGLEEEPFSPRPTGPLYTLRAHTPMMDEQYIRPEALLQSPMPIVSDDEFDRLRMDVRREGRLGMTYATAMRPDDTPARPMKRTMYGTELADDTRFGDFGCDEVASGTHNFWLSGRL